MKFHFNIFQNKEISVERSCQLSVNFYISLMQYNSTLLGRQWNQYEICKNKIIQQYHTHTFHKIWNFVCQTRKCVKGAARKVVTLHHNSMVFILQRTMRPYTMLMAAMFLWKKSQN